MQRLLLALFSLLLATSAFASGIEPPREKDRWTTLTIDELTIYSDASDSTTKSIATALERLRDALSTVTQLKVRSSMPMKVYVFNDRRTFVPFCDAVMGRSDRLSGVFLFHSDGNHVLIDGEANRVDRVVNHELTHYFLRNTIPADVPLWFNEGLAELYSTFTPHNDSVDVGLPIEEHIAWLRKQPLIPLSALFAIDHDSKEYHEGNRQGVFYAESWALVHYMMIGNPERRPQLGRYVGLIASGRPIDEAFREAFHTTYADLERELRKYLRGFSMSYIRYPVATLKPVAVPAPRPLSRDALLVALADLLVHATTPHFDEAETFLREALRLQPASADAYAELGLAKAWQREDAAAEQSFEKAVQLGSRDPLPYILYGDSILRGRGAHGGGTGEIEKARSLFRKAAELNPSSPLAFAGIGATYAMTSEDPAPGIAALERSLELAPSESEPLFNLILLDGRAGRRDDAAKRLDTLARIADPELVRQARESLLIADLIRANDLTKAGKHAEAVALMKNVAAQTSNERMKTQITEQLTSMDRVDAANGQVSDFQRAVEKANAGKLREALAMIDAMIPNIKDPEVLAAAKDFRAKVKEVIAGTAAKKKH
jgi:tetratricopeptide (TPR) repeat protein